MLKTKQQYDSSCLLDRDCLKYIYMPLLEKELESFADEWNSHRIRKQKEQLRPNGVPEDLYKFPELCGGTDMGYAVNEKDLRSIAEEKGVGVPLPDYISQEFRAAADAELSDYFDTITEENAHKAYMFLRYIFN
ncbi:uncharacterized protein LOC144352201 [Saccoglossus kowalevskii]